MDQLRITLKEAGDATKNNEYESSNGAFLVGYQSRLFCIHSDYSLVEVAQDFHCIGSGEEVALGSLYTSKRLVSNPVERIELALEAAATFCNGVGAPFHIRSL